MVHPQRLRDALAGAPLLLTPEAAAGVLRIGCTITPFRKETR